MPERLIISELLKAGDDYVSGSLLADQLGVSRVTIHSRVEKLQQEGIEIHAVRNRGYKLLKEPARICDAMLGAWLDMYDTPVSFVTLKETGSTNDDATRLLAEGKEDPFVVVAETQTGGRGRLSREWYSEASCGLYMSFGFRPKLPPGAMRRFTIWVGASLSAAISDLLNTDIKIKWPNDLYYNTRKLGGMLTEARIDSDTTRDLVFGLGVNYCPPEEGWPQGIAEVATSMKEASSEAPGINEACAKLITAVTDAYYSYLDGSYESEFNALWERFDMLKGRKVYTTGSSIVISGTADGVDSSGALRIRDASGNIHRIQAGDVSIRQDV